MQANPSTPTSSGLVSSQQGLPCRSRLLWEQQTVSSNFSRGRAGRGGNARCSISPRSKLGRADVGDMLTTLCGSTLKSLWVSRHAAPTPLNGGQAGFP